MKPLEPYQFSLKSALLSVTAISVTLACCVPAYRSFMRYALPSQRMLFVGMYLTLSPFVVPLVFLAYALGRCKVTTAMVLSFIAAECAAYYSITAFDALGGWEW